VHRDAHAPPTWLSASKRTTLLLLPMLAAACRSSYTVHPVAIYIIHYLSPCLGLPCHGVTSVHHAVSTAMPCPDEHEHELELAGQGRFYLVSLSRGPRGCLLACLRLPRADPSQLLLCLPQRTSPAAAPLRHAAWRLQSYRSPRIFVRSLLPIGLSPSSSSLSVLRLKGRPQGSTRRTFTEPETPVGLHPTHMTSHHACLASCSASCRVCF